MYRGCCGWARRKYAPGPLRKNGRLSLQRDALALPRLVRARPPRYIPGPLRRRSRPADLCPDPGVHLSIVTSVQ